MNSIYQGDLRSRIRRDQNVNAKMTGHSFGNPFFKLSYLLTG